MKAGGMIRAALLLLAGLIVLLPGIGSCAAEATSECPLRFSEVMTDNDTVVLCEGGSPVDWIEIENTSDSEIALNGYLLERSDIPERATVLWGTVPAHGFIVIAADGKKQLPDREGLHVDFKLPASGCTIRLLDPAGRELDSLTVPMLSADSSYALSDKGSWYRCLTPTPGEPPAPSRNAADVPVLTEIMAANVSYAVPGTSGCYDYAELYNAGTATIDLSDWSLTDDEKKTEKLLFPQGTLLGPGEYLLICFAGVTEPVGEGILTADFRLSMEGCTLTLLDVERKTVDRFIVPQAERDIARSLTESGWTTELPPTPGLTNDRSSVDALYRQLAAENPTGVQLSELCTASFDGPDWIELYNASDASVDLSGWGLSDVSGHPRKWQFPSGTVIGAGKYIRIDCVGRDGSSESLSADFRLSAEGGYEVTLCESDGNIVDRVRVDRMEKGLSLGRIAVGDTWRVFAVPTPGKKNSGTYAMGSCPVPSCSISGGLFGAGEQVSVELSCSLTTASIYYTTDCTEPSASS